jgi:hypothetical protein
MAAIATATILEEDLADTFPGHAIGATAMFTVLWWTLLMFIYVKNNSADDLLRNFLGEEVLPIAWFWERLWEETDIYVYLAIALMWGFVSQIFVSFMEIVAYITWVVGYQQLFMFWTSIPGVYGSLVLYAMPWVLLCVQLGITMKGKVQAAPGSYVLFLFVVYFTLWLLNSVVHLVFVPRSTAYMMTMLNKMAKE